MPLTTTASSKKEKLAKVRAVRHGVASGVDFAPGDVLTIGESDFRLLSVDAQPPFSQKKFVELIGWL